MRTTQMSHGGVASGLADTDHRLVVFAETEPVLNLQDSIPQIKRWQSLSAKSPRTGNELCLWGAATHSLLLLANAHEGKTRVRALNCNVGSCGGAS